MAPLCKGSCPSKARTEGLFISFFSPSGSSSHLPRQREAHCPSSPRPQSGSLCEGAVNRRLTEGESFQALPSARTLGSPSGRAVSHRLTERAKETDKASPSSPSPLCGGDHPSPLHLNKFMPPEPVGDDAHIVPSRLHLPPGGCGHPPLRLRYRLLG